MNLNKFTKAFYDSALRNAWGGMHGDNYHPTLNVNSGSLNPSDLDFDSGKLARNKMIEVHNILISHTSKMTSGELRCHIKMSGHAWSVQCSEDKDKDKDNDNDKDKDIDRDNEMSH